MIRVLYVDDEPDLLDIGKIFLEMAGGIEVDTALSAQTALAMMEKKQYDGIVSDFQMPDMDGIAFLKQMRSCPEDIAFILFTGKGCEEVAIEALNNGADFYIRKGGDPKSQFTELEHKIRLLVRNRMAGIDLGKKYKKITLLNNISRHEIANNLTILRRKIKLIKRLSKDPVLLPHFSKIEEAAKEIYNNLEISRISQEAGITVQKWHRVGDILGDVVPRADAAGIRYSIDVNNLEIFADPLLSRVFLNLQDNTMRHGSHVTTITISCQRFERGMKIIWEDDGIGIPAEDKERIFDQGYGKNTGLGLYLCREILAITGITIQECGFPGTGARFELLIPEGNYRGAGDQG